MLKQLELFSTKFVLHTFGREFRCYTEEEVWTKIERLPFGQCYWVTSPKGEDVSGFIPF